MAFCWKKELSGQLPSSLLTKMLFLTFYSGQPGSPPVPTRVLLIFTLIWCFSASGIRSAFKFRATPYLKSWEALEPRQALSLKHSDSLLLALCENILWNVLSTCEFSLCHRSNVCSHVVLELFCSFSPFRYVSWPARLIISVKNLESIQKDEWIWAIYLSFLNLNLLISPTRVLLPASQNCSEDYMFPAYLAHGGNLTHVDFLSPSFPLFPPCLPSSTSFLPSHLW